MAATRRYRVHFPTRPVPDQTAFPEQASKIAPQSRARFAKWIAALSCPAYQMKLNGLSFPFLALSVALPLYATEIAGILGTGHIRRKALCRAFSRRVRSNMGLAGRTIESQVSTRRASRVRGFLNDGYKPCRTTPLAAHPASAASPDHSREWFVPFHDVGRSAPATIPRPPLARHPCPDWRLGCLPSRSTSAGEGSSNGVRCPSFRHPVWPANGAWACLSGWCFTLPAP